MPAEISQPVRFHLSVNVSDLGKSVQFFQGLFGKEPAKRRSDYAKFELDDPPLVFSLEPHAPAGRGALNHAGFRFSDSTKLVEAQRRLEIAGIHTRREEGVECCYARQTKFWANDPDGGLWEFYVLEGDIDHRGAGQAVEAVTASDAPAARSWEHRLGQPLVVPGEFGEMSLDEARLRGTFNVPVESDEVVRFLKEVRTALRPGGSLLLHILTAQAPLSSAPQLPGGAGSVKYVPACGDLLNSLETAGFADMQLTTFRSRACFEYEGIALRETRITCHRPATSGGELCTVVFKGPFAEATDDEGHTWRRGQKTAIPLARWEALQRTPIADLFVELPSETVVGACGT
ncbi:MAG: ArsI/CadI family heavy metal resistance metalloenzyme [Deltaproteobacteria bacterium]